MSTSYPQVFAVAAMAATVAARGDVLLDQPPDFRTSWRSFNFRPSADDYRPDGPVIVETATFWMVATWPNVPRFWQLEIYETVRFEYPFPYLPHFWPLFRMIGASEVIDLGPWDQDESMHLFEVRFENINQRLDPGPFDGGEGRDGAPLVGGIYWISCAGLLWDARSDKCEWVTSGRGRINWDPGWVKTKSSWWPLQAWDRTDFAMRIEGWPVSAGDDDNATNTEVEVNHGHLLDGGLREIRSSDGMHLVAVSHPYSGGHRTEFIVHARTTIENPQSLDLTMQAKIRRNNGGEVSGRQNAYMWNWKTGRFDSLGQYSIWWRPIVLPFRDLDASKYINENGEIEVLITHDNDMSRFNIAFLSFIDRVQIEVAGPQD